MAWRAKEKGNSYLSGAHIYKKHECPQCIVCVCGVRPCIFNITHLCNIKSNILIRGSLISKQMKGTSLNWAETDQFASPQLSLQMFCVIVNLWCKLDLKERVTTNEIKCKPEQKQGGRVQRSWFQGVSCYGYLDFQMLPTPALRAVLQ